MSAVKFIVSVVLAIVFLYFTVTGVQNLIQDGKDLEQAQKEYDIAVAENNAAQAELDNVIKYGCASPTVGPGFVSCPN